MTEDDSRALDEELAAADDSHRAEQFLLVAHEVLRVLEQPHEPGDQDRLEYLKTLMAELRNTQWGR